MAVLDLEEQLAFYGTYHTHPRNIAIHLLFVPILMFTIFLWASNAALPDLPYANLSTLVSTVYGLLYILMEPVAGALFFPFVIGQSIAGTYCVQRWGADANWIAGVVQAVSWISQFVGHGVFEGRKPALVDNLVQALFLAPLFVWIEALMMGGYRPELKARMKEKVKAARARLDEKEGIKRNGDVKEL